MKTIRHGRLGASGTRGPAASEAGFSLLEVSIAGSVMLMGVLMFSQTVVGGIGSQREVRERSVALGALESTIERLRSEPFDSLFTRYNRTPADDPGGAGSGPGPHFAIAGLDAASDDEDGLPGEVLFPVSEVVGEAGLLREDLPSARFGLPYDLDHDGNISADSVAQTYQLLPVIVRVRWRGEKGPQQVEVATWLSNH